MAGSLIEIQVKDEEMKRALSAIDARLGSQRPAWELIGEIVIESVQRNFEQHRAPDGTAWAPVSPRYAAVKARKGYDPENILILHRVLMGSIHRSAGDDHVSVGTDIVYAAIHQFGGVFGKRSSLETGKVVGARTQVLAHKEGGGFMSRKEASKKKKGSISISIADIGGHQINMPARSYLGVRDEDWPEITQVLGRYIVTGR